MMNFKSPTCLLLICVVFALPLPRNAQGQTEYDSFRTGAVFATIGSADGETTTSLGIRGPFFGLELGMLKKSEINRNDFIETSIPHNDYTDLGWKRDYPIFGFDGLAYKQFLGRGSFYFGVGVYFESRVRVAQSNVTGWIWQQDEEFGVLGALTGGLQVAVGEKLLLGAGYHSLRGANALLGLRF